MLKNLFTLGLLLALSVSAFAFDTKTDNTLSALSATAASIDPAFAQMNVEQFLGMTPKEFEKMTGQKLGLKKAFALKQAQKQIRKATGASPDDLDKTLYIVLAIVIPFVAVGIASDWEGSNWIVALVLTVLLCWIGGVIYALIKMKNYYN
jgi:uncharacterized membrane protein YqaE (UPF0057 family)